jgi:hypothetical protein
VIVPPPAPSYTLAPDVEPLSPGQQATLNACLGALTGRVAGVVVTSAITTATHHVVELMTPAGNLIAMERAAPPEPPGLEAWALSRLPSPLRPGGEPG